MEWEKRAHLPHFSWQYGDMKLTVVWRQCGGRWNQLHHGSITTMATVSEANSRVTGNWEQARERLSEQGREESFKERIRLKETFPESNGLINMSSTETKSQGFFHNHHHHHHRSSMVPTAVPRLLPENGSLLGGIAQITPNLFLSRGNVASNRSLLLSKGITCVVNATIELPNFNWPHMEYVKVPLADMPHSPISLYFDSVADKIHSVGRKRGAVLVHCAAGVSRSASLCLAYLMKYHRVSLAEAHAWVKARRPVIRPNGGFWRQLIEYERKLFGRNSVKMVQTPYGVIPDVYERDRRSLAPYWGL
ncbi:hypothetical protein INR49_016496 [Caranx melampygus]|nr:hypothetical protein INR49_016496 [Caranx melampygus]